MRQSDPPILLACDWLLAFLQPGPRLAVEVLAAASALGVSPSTLHRAKFLLQVKSVKAGFRDPWYWVHPDQRFWFDPTRDELRHYAPLVRERLQESPKIANEPSQDFIAIATSAQEWRRCSK